MKDAAMHLKKLYLELGGKNPNIVKYLFRFFRFFNDFSQTKKIFEDANLDDCVQTTVRSSFQNQGIVCFDIKI